MCGGGQGWFVLAWGVPEQRPNPPAVTAVAITAIPANLLAFAYRVVMVTPFLSHSEPPTYSVNELRPPAGSKQNRQMCLHWQTVATLGRQLDSNSRNCRHTGGLIAHERFDFHSV